MKVVSFTICPFVQRVTALLEAKGAAYDIEYISLSDKPQWFLDISPNAQVPIVIVGEQVLFESDAIVEYIEDTIAPPTLPQDPIAKAQMRAWSYLATKHYLVQCGSQRSADETIFNDRFKKIAKAFSKINRYAKDNSFLQGGGLQEGNFSAVDIAWLPILHRAHIIKKHTGFDYLKDYADLQVWQAALMATGIPDKSVAADFEEKFIAFYLPETNYLGQMRLQLA